MTFQEGDVVRIRTQLSIDETCAFSHYNGRRPLYMHERGEVFDVDGDCVCIAMCDDGEHFDVKAEWIEKVQS